VCYAGLVLGLPPAAAQQSNIDFSVSGTSTIRSWTCTVSGSVQVTPGGASPALPGFSTGIQSATLTVPVKAFACPNEEMTRHLLEAMEADKFPQITFRLDRYEMKGGRAEATGMLTITDVTAPISVPVSLKASGQALQLEGNTRLDMTRFGVDPPVVMLGLLKVGPQIRIEFRGTIAR
jgi:hypothetical protein